MLDGLLGRSGFSSKCKSLIKPTRTRIEVLRRRAEAKQRFLKEDLAKLLANGLDVNAYGRTEDFIAGLNMLSCYNFIDQSCEYILKQLSVMQKLGQCPEDCRETVASLMFAAARFSDLPELRDLRDVFQDRYGNGLECYVNQVFVEKLASKPPVVEKRIKLLQDIATEFSIQWDSKGFKQRMDSPSTLAQDQVKKCVPLIAKDDKYKVPSENNVFRKHDHRSKERIENIPHRDIPFTRTEEKHAQDQSMKPRPSKERIEHSYEGPTLHNNGNVNSRRKDVSDIPFVRREEGYFSKPQDQSMKPRPSKERIEHSYEGPTLHNNGNVNSRRKDVSDIPFVRREEGYFSKPRPESDSENNGIGTNHIPSITKTSDTPSYHNRRPEASSNDRGRKERHSRMPQVNGDEQNHEKSTRKIEVEEPIKLLKPCYNNSPLPPPYIKSSLPNLPPPYTKPTTHREPPPSGDIPPEIPSNSERRNREREHRHYQNDIPLPKPRSVRRKHSKSSSSHDDVGSSEDSRIVKRISSSRRKERKGLQILFDDEHYHRKDDEEEKMMDKLLLHYSKKPSVYEGKLKKKKSRSNTSKSPVDDVDNVETIGQPVRSISLPHETEPKKVYARANSFQPDNQAPHVHPKLPDYDDLAARFAALRGR